MAAADEAREDACREYQSSLEDLTFNSKPHINMLTILAEENLQFAKDIVTLIEAQIAKAPITEKLPVMYLMDSIVKNVGRDYLAAFAKNIVSTFVIVFDKVDENTRKSLYKLRSTWDDIFTSKKLYALDVRVNQVDPAWPVKPLPPNVNTASIHVNPKFLNKPEESTTPPTPVPKPVPSRTNPELPKPHLKQEQLIRQQLLMKQKQLLELQQKKLELELEQTKAQLANSVSSVPTKPNVVPEIPHMPVKAVQPTSTTHSEKNKNPVAAPPDKTPVPTRDPRLNRGNQHSSHTKDQPHKKEIKTNLPNPPDSKPLKPVSSDKTSSSSKQEKNKPGEKLLAKKEPVSVDLKGKAKSPLPLIPKLSHAKDSKSAAADGTRDSDASRRDPRLRKHVRDKSDDKPEEIKEKRKSTEKKEDHKSSEHRPSGNRNKIVNGVVQKNDSSANDSDKLSQKLGRSSNRKRSRSRSPKSRRDRRSPLKRRQRSQSPIPPRSRSPIPSVSKNSKLRQAGSKPPHTGDFPASTRDERSKRIPKLDPRDSRRQKRPSEERQKRPSEERQQDSNTPLFSKSGSEPKENVENWQGSKMGKRWRPGWEEGKSTQNEDHHQGNRNSYQRHRDSWSSNGSKGILSPRTPKQQPWLSVDANLKIPKELTNASKGELLKKANERLESGEITQDDFLMVAHQIRQLFQYQEDKNRCVYSSPTEEEIISGVRKKPLLSNAELTYYQHKAKLKRTQVQQNCMDQDFMDEPMDELTAGDGEEEHIDRIGEHLERISNSLSERNEQFPERMNRHSPIPGTLLLEEDLPHEGHRRPDDTRELPRGLRDESRTYSERYPHNLNRYDDKEQVPFVDSTDPVIKESSKHVGLLEERRPLLDIPPLMPIRVDDAASQRFEDMDIREDSPVKRFDGPLGNQAGGQLFENKVQPMDFDPLGGSLVDSSRFDTISGQPSNSQSQTLQRFEGVQNQMVITAPTAGQRMDASPGPPLVPRFDGSQGQHLGSQMFDGIPGQPIGPTRFDGVQPVGQQRFEAGLGPGPQRFDGPQRFEGGPVQQSFDGPQLFEGVQRFEGGPQRFDGVGPQRFEGVQRFDGNAGHQRFDGPQRFEGPPRPQLLQQRFEGSQGPPMGFEQTMPQPVMFDGTRQPMGTVRFDGPHGPRFDGPHGPRFDGQPGARFDGHPGPRFDGPPGTRFDCPQGPRFDANKGPRFDHGPGPQGLMRFDGPMGQAGPRFDNLPVTRFENHPSLLPRYEGVPGQQCTRFDGPPGHQTPPRFDGPVHMQPRFEVPMQQRFDGPNQQPRFDMPMGPQGQRFENINPPIGQNTAPFVQTAPFVDPQNVFHGQSQGMQFPRPEQRYDMPQGSGFTGPPAPGMPLFPNQLPRPAAPYFDDKNPQGPPFGNFNLPVANIQPNPPFPSMGAMTQPAPFNQEQMLGSVQAPNTGTFVQNQAAASFPNPENHLGQLDVNELFSKLLSTGIIKGSQSEPSSSSQTETTPSQPAAEEEEEEPAEEHEIPDLTSFVLDDMKPRFECVITRLYTGIQCYSCGMRFTKSQTDVYADHLDWHYRQNRTEKDVSRKITHRRWYYSLTDWIEFEEIADLEERAKSQFFEKVHEEVILKTQEAAKEKEFQSVPAGPAGADEICEICQEQFEQYWDEEEEEWHLKNAMRVNDKIYHPSCYEDYKNTSSFLDSTPSPSKVLLENPLSAMLSLVKEETADTTSSAVKVKEEPTDDRPSSRGESIPLLAEIKSEPTNPE
ncbi:pre-mRNA cleavage complex 2 protein Pcf11 [Mantella aurantiaca]